MPYADSPYGRDWQKLRARFLHHHRFCRLCKKPSQHVDHITPIRVAPELRLEWTNLQALCASCHDRLTNAYDIERHKGCDEHGLPISHRHPWAAGGIARRNPNAKRDWVRATLKKIAAGKNPDESWRERE